MLRGSRNPIIHRAALAATALVILLWTGASASDLAPRMVPPTPGSHAWGFGQRSDLVIVKFIEGSDIRLRNGALVSLTGANIEDSRALLAAPDLQLDRLFTRPEATLEADRQRAQLASGRELADLNNYYAVRLPAANLARTERLLNELNALDMVEIAYPEPIVEPAVRPAADARGSGPVAVGGTPDFQGLQGYLGPAPDGIDAEAGWTFSGGHGETVRIIDVELGFNWSHEDMPSPFFDGGPSAYSDHGTAVTGIIASEDNGFGVTGIAHGSSIGSYNVSGKATAAIFDEIAATLSPGDIFVIELHCPGPNSNGSGQFGYIPLEFWQANFDAIAMATANGVICCQAGGNGAQDLDEPIYDQRFDRSIRDSGAIIVGATDGSSLDPASFSNHGSRVDLSGWGYDVTSTGYGNLQGGPDSNMWYTDSFSGTSSATPIVTGAVAIMQGVHKATHGTPLSGQTIAQLLKETGTPHNGPSLVGARPNLALAVPAMLGQLTSIEGVIRDDSMQPIADVEVTVLESGTRTTSAADGSYALAITEGNFTVRAQKFGYATDERMVSTTPVTAHDIALTQLTTSSVSGFVTDDTGALIVGATVTLRGTPIAPVMSNASGSYQIDDVPEGIEFVALATVTGRSPDALLLLSGVATSYDFRLGTPERFEGSDGGLSGTRSWEWGFPSLPEGPSPHSGSLVWGTDLNGGYDSSGFSVLTSPDYDLSLLTAPRMSFWHWYNIWGPFDGITVEVSTNGGSTWGSIEPIGEYPDRCINGAFTNPCLPGWTNISDGWEPVVFDLGPLSTSTVRFRWSLMPLGFPGTPGWYIDDLAIHGENETVSVSAAAPAPPMLRVGQAAPTPSLGPVSIAYDLPSTARVTARVFDAPGRLVRSLMSETRDAGTHHLTWDALDARNRRAGAGVYFIELRVEGSDGAVVRQTRKIVLSR